MASAIPDKPRVSPSSIRRLMNPPSRSRLRPAVAGLRRIERLERASVDPPLPRLRRTGFVEDFFFIIGIWFCVKSILEESRRCRPRFPRGGCLDSRDLKMQETPF